jgi:hypothetical protein
MALLVSCSHLFGLIVAKVSYKLICAIDLDSAETVPFHVQLDYEKWATADHNVSSSFTSSWQVRAFSGNVLRIMWQLASGPFGALCFVLTA